MPATRVDETGGRLSVDPVEMYRGRVVRRDEGFEGPSVDGTARAEERPIPDHLHWNSGELRGQQGQGVHGGVVRELQVVENEYQWLACRQHVQSDHDSLDEGETACGRRRWGVGIVPFGHQRVDDTGDRAAHGGPGGLAQLGAQLPEHLNPHPQQRHLHPGGVRGPGHDDARAMPLVGDRQRQRRLADAALARQAR